MGVSDITLQRCCACVFFFYHVQTCWRSATTSEWHCTGVSQLDHRVLLARCCVALCAYRRDKRNIFSVIFHELNIEQLN